MVFSCLILNLSHIYLSFLWEAFNSRFIQFLCHELVRSIRPSAFTLLFCYGLQSIFLKSRKHPTGLLFYHSSKLGSGTQNRSKVLVVTRVDNNKKQLYQYTATTQCSSYIESCCSHLPQPDNADRLSSRCCCAVILLE